MKTFNIALKYLRNVDLRGADIYANPTDYEGGISTATGEVIPATEPPQWMKNVIRVKESFDADKDNNVSNDTYRSTVFEVALYHLLDLEEINRVGHEGFELSRSYFQVACDIVRKHDKGMFHFLLKKQGAYPKVMWDEWDKYCEAQNHKPFYIESEMMPEILMVAYHYVKDKNS